MLPDFLVPEADFQKDGQSRPLELGASRGKLLILTLGITHHKEQQSLDVTIWGSADGKEWGAAPLLAFQQKFYQGIAAMLLDLSDKAGVNFLQARWKMARWGRGEPTPLFRFYLFVQESAVRLAAAQGAQPPTAG